MNVLHELTTMHPPFALVLVGFLIAVTVMACFFRASRVHDEVRDAVDYERASNARRITSQPDGS